MKEKDNGAGDTIFFNLYLIDKFGNAANKKKNTVLDYEMEYLLGGKASDKDNLEYVIGRIRILRFAVNYGYLLTDKDMQMEVDTLATTLSAVFLSPEIGPVIKHALLLAWAYGESLTDVKTLLAGKKVPAVKSKESWNLTLDGLLELAKNRSIPEGKETEEGNSYEQYLQMMLVLKSKEELSMRALDLVEMNLRSGMEKTFFRADACVSGADFDMTCYLRRGIRYQYHILKNENVRRWIQVSFLRTIEIINKIPLMMYRKILNYKHIFDIRRKEEGFDFLPDLIAISCVKEKASVSASVTVEAVLCVPLFLYAAVSLIWISEASSLQ